MIYYFIMKEVNWHYFHTCHLHRVLRCKYISYDKICIHNVRHLPFSLLHAKLNIIILIIYEEISRMINLLLHSLFLFQKWNLFYRPNIRLDKIYILLQQAAWDVLKIFSLKKIFDKVIFKEIDYQKPKRFLFTQILHGNILKGQKQLIISFKIKYFHLRNNVKRLIKHF